MLRLRVGGLAVGLGLLGSSVRGAAQPAQEAVVKQRTESLLKQMTLEEKLGQMNQLFFSGPPKPIEEQVAQGRVGSLLFVTDPAVINRMQHLAVEKTRLHIPLLFGFDVIHGFRTIFPVPIAMAASWDPEMATRVQTVAAKEARSAGINWAFAPMVDIARDPRWGRIVEGAGEDPYLGSAMAVAQVRGFQGDHLGAADHVLSTVKHFVGYGAAEGGRDYDASYLSETQLQNVYLPPFHAAVKAGVGSVMSAYMDLNDVPAAGNRWLLTDLLRGDWGFQGLVVSDANAVKSLQNHGFASSAADAAVRAVNAGVDMEMAIGKTAFSQGLRAAVVSGAVPLARIDAAVNDILTVKVRLGLFEHPYVDEAQSKLTLATPEHRVLARQAAERSAVLLRNEGGLLPLNRASYKKVAVVGPLADSAIDTLGSWAFQEDLAETVTVLRGLKEKWGPQAHVEFAPGVQISRRFPSFFDAIVHLQETPKWSPEQVKREMGKALDLAKASDLTILVMGEAQNMSGEAASRDSLRLPGQQEALLDAVAAVGKPAVLVLLSGRPMNITRGAELLPSILEVWYPGTQGGAAVANLLVGEAVPGGKLPMAWPRIVGQIPINYAHNLTQAPEDQGKRYWNEPSTPLFQFGYGLSYATFSFANLRLGRSRLPVGESVEVSVDLENTGSVTADEVAQLYIHQQFGSTSRPVRELKGFQRVTLAAHAKQTLHFTLSKEDLSYWSSATKDWVTEPSVFDVWVGSSADAPLHSSFELTRP